MLNLYRGLRLFSQNVAINRTYRLMGLSKSVIIIGVISPLSGLMLG